MSFCGTHLSIAGNDTMSKSHYRASSFCLHALGDLVLLLVGKAWWPDQEAERSHIYLHIGSREDILSPQRSSRLGSFMTSLKSVISWGQGVQIRESLGGISHSSQHRRLSCVTPIKNVFKKLFWRSCFLEK